MHVSGKLFANGHSFLVWLLQGQINSLLSFLIWLCVGKEKLGENEKTGKVGCCLFLLFTYVTYKWYRPWCVQAPQRKSKGLEKTWILWKATQIFWENNVVYKQNKYTRSTLPKCITVKIPMVKQNHRTFELLNEKFQGSKRLQILCTAFKNLAASSEINLPI